MYVFVFLSIIILVLLGIYAYDKKYRTDPKTIKILFLIAVIGSALSILGLMVSFVIGGKMETLFKISVPLTVIVISMLARKSLNEKGDLKV